jgi:hypothetical protein
MLTALYKLPRTALRAVIIWALGAGPELVNDAAGMDKIAADAK